MVVADTAEEIPAATSATAVGKFRLPWPALSGGRAICVTDRPCVACCVAKSESQAHLELKRLALIWAQANGYPIVATEVSLPNLRFRLDAAAYRPGSLRLLKFDELRKTSRYATFPAVGVTTIFECKAHRADLIRDCRISVLLLERIRVLSEMRIEIETRLRIEAPSLLRGDGLWPEYETADFGRSEDPQYQKIVRQLRSLGFQVHGQTKMEKLLKWKAGNLHYLVVEPGIIAKHEIPSGWGLLVRNGRKLEVERLPEFQEIPMEVRLAFLHRVAAAGSKSANRELGIRYEDIDAERRGIEPEVPPAEEP